MNISETLISFDTAKLAKEKGFNIPTYNYWHTSYKNKPFCTKGIDYDSDKNVKWDWNNNSGVGIPSPYPNKEEKEQCSAPTQSLLQRWLREKHCLHIVIEHDSDMYYYVIQSVHKSLYIPTIDSSENGLVYQTYEEALEKGLQEALKLIP